MIVLFLLWPILWVWLFLSSITLLFFFKSWRNNSKVVYVFQIKNNYLLINLLYRILFVTPHLIIKNIYTKKDIFKFIFSTLWGVLILIVTKVPFFIWLMLCICLDAYKDYLMFLSLKETIILLIKPNEELTRYLLKKVDERLYSQVMGRQCCLILKSVDKVSYTPF